MASLTKKASFTCLLVVLAVVLATFISLNSRREDRQKLKSSLRAVDSLRLIVVITRHGNKPNYDYPGDQFPIDDVRFWPYGRNALTPKGRVHMYRTGQRIRSLYHGFLKDRFLPQEVRASSTSGDRTLMSGQMFLAGLYPPVDDLGTPLQPVTLYSDSPDNVMREHECPRYIQMRDENQREFGRVFANNISELNQEVERATGQQRSGFLHAFQVWHKVSSEDIEGYTFPQWVNKIYPEPLKALVGENCFWRWARSKEMTRLLMGELFREVVESMQRKAEGTLSPDRHLIYYSGHDMSIVDMQMMLGVLREDLRLIVRPASALLLELHQEPQTDKHYLQVMYIDSGSPNLDPVPLNLTLCGTPCYLDNLIKYRAYFLADVDFKTECVISGS